MHGGKKPTVAQLRWQTWQRERNCCNCGQPASIHHAVGSSAKHDKVEIGQWFTIALCDTPCHKLPHGIHGDRSALSREGSRKEVEKAYFAKDVFDYFHYDAGELPMALEVYEAIMGYHR